MALTKVKLIADGTIVQSNLHASHGITTADIGENASYLYYTDARARAAVSVSGNALSYNSSTGVITSNFEESPTFTGNVVIDGTLGVGISPNEKLTVNGNIESLDTFILKNSGGHKWQQLFSTNDFVIRYNNTSSWYERMRIKDNGQVNISQKPNSGLAYDVLINVGTSPDGVIGYTTVDQLAANIGASTSSNWVKTGNYIYNSNSGNIGIGETNPQYGKLQIKTASAIGYTPTSFINGTNLRLTAGGTAATNVTTGVSFGIGGAAEAYIGAVQNSSAYADVVLQTYHGAYGERIRITSAGNVGIGTDSPSPKLHLQYADGSYSSDSTSGFINEATTGRGTMRIRSATDNPAELFFDTNGAIRWDISCRNGSSPNLQFYPQAATPALNNVALHTFELQQDGDVIVTGNGSGGRMGIGTTNPDGRLDVRGAISSGMALEDTDVSLTSNGGSPQATGILEISQGWSAGTSNGDTIVFRHNSTSWKSWILHYNFASTNGMTIGVIGGYWNNSGSNTSNTSINNLGMSAAVTHGGTGNQNIIVTFTFTALGTHPLSSFKYIQHGGDGKPLASKTSITLNS